MSAETQVKTRAKMPAALSPPRAVQPLLAVPEREGERPDLATQMDSAARLGHSLGAISVYGSTPPIVQRQELPEEEEDKEELQMQRAPAAVQRQELPEEEEEEALQMQPKPAAFQRQELPEEEEEELQKKPEIPGVGLEGGLVPLDVEAAIGRARGGGQPLGGVLQAQMGETLGHDFSAVRVHTDAEAHALNEQLSAKAFTTGRDIFFRQGTYEPGSGSGRELLAHELSHVVQQSTGQVSGSSSGLTVRPAGDPFEREADSCARGVTPVEREPGVAIQREFYAENSPYRANKVLIERETNAMGLSLGDNSEADVVLEKLIARTHADHYHSQQNDWKTGLQSRVWNCKSLTAWLEALYAYVHDVAPGSKSTRVHYQKQRVSKTDVMPNVILLPNVEEWVGPELARTRYCFMAHTVLNIDGQLYDPLMGVKAGYEEAFPYEVKDGQVTIEGREYKLKDIGESESGMSLYHLESPKEPPATL